MLYAILALAAAVLVSAIILRGALTTMTKQTQDAAARVEASTEKLLSTVQQLLAKFDETTASLRQIAANAAGTTGDDASIQLNATADKLDAEVAVIAGDLAGPTPTPTAVVISTDAGQAIITQHPTDGTTLVTPITTGDAPTSVDIHPDTGVPSVPGAPAGTLGETTVAGPEVPSVADAAAAGAPVVATAG